MAMIGFAQRALRLGDDRGQSLRGRPSHGDGEFDLRGEEADAAGALGTIGGEVATVDRGVQRLGGPSVAGDRGIVGQPQAVVVAGLIG